MGGGASWIWNRSRPIFSVTDILGRPVTDAWGACGDNAANTSVAEACKGVSCSGHGTCAVLAEGGKICVCAPGYHSAGLDCEPDEPGSECSGVDCSGHGTCVVAQADGPYPVCICDDGYHVAGNTNCVSGGNVGVSCGPGTHEEDGVCVPDAAPTPEDPTPDVCNENSSCAAGEVCLYETGQCISPGPDICGLPDNPAAADVPLGGKCLPSEGCLDGLVCVWSTTVMGLDRNSGTYDYLADPDIVEGVCMDACDPCNDPEGTCVALSSGGGFRPVGMPVRSEGQDCSTQDAEVPDLFCEAGTACVEGVCRRICVPDDSRLWDDDVDVRYFSGAAESRDCPAGTACKLSLLSNWGDRWICVAAELRSHGEQCSDPARPLDLCTLPLECKNITAGGLARRPGTCGPMDGVANCTDCPAGTNCRFDGYSGSDPRERACIAPGSVGYRGACEEDVDCRPPLTCQSSSWGPSCLP